MSAQHARNRPAVLVVEDEALVRMTAADELEEAGFRVLEAANAEGALELLERCASEVQVLFTDVNMPGSMDGIELAEQVNSRWPHIRLLISSGYACPDAADLPDHGRFVPKPYIGPSLARHIRELIRM